MIKAMNKLEARDPDDRLLQAEQDAAIEVCLHLAAAPPRFPISEEVIEEEMWRLGSALQPATEGLCRLHPKRAYLSQYHSSPYPVAGPEAYRLWMQSSYADKSLASLEYRSGPAAGMVTALMVGIYDTGDVGVVQCEPADLRQLPAIDKVLSINQVVLRNSYGAADGTEARQAAREYFWDEVRLDADEHLYSHRPLDTRPHPKQGLEDEIREWLGPAEADTFRQYGALGLARLRAYTLLRTALENAGG